MTRTLDKQEAIRHLIHAAIRMIRAEDDAFAIHVLVQSADKLLIDLAKHKGVKLAQEWGSRMTPENRDKFLKRYRETYNFFKHADRDHDQSLSVPDMMVLNVVVLAACVINYEILYNHRTEHMKAYLIFAIAAFPGSMFKEAVKIAHFKAMDLLTPRDFFRGLDHPTIATRFPRIDKEKSADLIDNGDLPDIEDRHFRKK